MNLLILTARFLDNRYHGLLTKKGPPEWPPSPYRLFQALVSGVARRGELVEGEDVLNNKNLTPIGRALDWLQKHTSIHPPVIIAPRSKAYQKGDGVICFVPNNDDETHFHPELHRVAKPTIPTHMLLEPDEKPEVHYVWDISSQPDTPVDRIRDAARSLTTLGWGIDMAFADARLAIEDDIQKLKGIRWYPKKNAGSFHDTLRTPTYNVEMGKCTLCDLRHCHSTFINRIEHGKPLKTVDKPRIFDRVLYTSTERPVGRPCAIFKLVDENDDTISYSQAKLVHIAGMVRHLARDRMKDNPPRNLQERNRDRDEWLRSYVMGHQSSEDKAANKPHTQFSYVPLQSIGVTHTDPGVRRVMIIAPVGDEAFLEHIAQQLDGGILTPLPGTTLPPGTHLQRITDGVRDGVRDMYVGRSGDWASATPVILECHIKKKRVTDKDGREVEITNHVDLIRKALKHAGIEQPCEFEWSPFSYFRKSLSAYKYRHDTNDPSKIVHINYVRPDHLLDKSAVHVILRFGVRENPNDEKSRWIAAEHPIPGPITIGAGRHCGLGIFARMDD